MNVFLFKKNNLSLLHTPLSLPANCAFCAVPQQKSKNVPLAACHAIQRPNQLDHFTDMFFVRSQGTTLIIAETHHRRACGHADPGLPLFSRCVEEPESLVVHFEGATVGNNNKVVMEHHGLRRFDTFGLRGDFCVQDNPGMLLNLESSAHQGLREDNSLSGGTKTEHDHTMFRVGHMK